MTDNMMPGHNVMIGKKIIPIVTMLLVPMLLMGQYVHADNKCAVHEASLSPKILIPAEVVAGVRQFTQQPVSLDRLYRENKLSARVESLLGKVRYYKSDNISAARDRDTVRQNGLDIETVLYIQNNRTGKCSGRCENCYKYHGGWGNDRVLDPLSLQDIERLVYQAFVFDIRTISLNGEDSFDDWPSLLTIARACVTGKEQILYPFGYALHIFSNGYAILNDLDNAEKKFRELKSTGADFRLCLSWDYDKVMFLSKSGGITEDAVITNMALMLIAFRKVFPESELIINNTVTSGQKERNRIFLRQLDEKFTRLSGKRKYPAWTVWNGRRSEFAGSSSDTKVTWRDRFKKLVAKAQRQDFICYYNSFIDAATGTLSNCTIYSTNGRRKVSVATLREMLLAPFQHPLMRHLYYGNREERGRAKCREFLFACCLRPDYWNQPLFFEQFETKIMNDPVLRTKTALLSLLRDILLNYETYDMSPPFVSRLESFPKEIIPFLVDDEIVKAYLHYIDEIRYRQIMKDGYGDNHGFFNLYYVWTDFKQGRISNKEELARRTGNVCRTYQFEAFLPYIRNIARRMGADIGPGSDPDDTWKFFEQLTRHDMEVIFRNVLEEQIIPSFYTRPNNNAFSFRTMPVLLNPNIAKSDFVSTAI
ncbi:MAG: hypothetical protein PHO30_00800 [Candidatus Omnitrophica bacterium]|nr:hypothetical protein [Candidatus Omnitrophota bacterium]